MAARERARVTGMVNEMRELRNLVSRSSRSMGCRVYDVVVGVQSAGRPQDASVSGLMSHAVATRVGLPACSGVQKHPANM